jgi:hypothetical protein
LPRNSSQTLFLYITARSSASELRVELLNDNGSVITSQQARILSLLPRDTLYAVVTQATSGSVDLSSLNIGGYEAFQTNWTISDIPDRSAALDAINVMLINDIDTGDLTRDQHEALKSWVMGGGHLIVAGGANWQSTAAGLEDLLPLVPTGSETVADLTQLTRFAGDYETEFTGEVIAATGTLTDSAEILVTAEDDIPLAVRQSIGAGTVDYVAVDPSSQPLRGWDKLPDLWFSLLSSTDAQPSWTHGFSHWDDAISSVEIIPGVNLLPAVLGLFGFLAGYVFLIGPVNYLVLRRFNPDIAVAGQRHPHYLRHQHLPEDRQRLHSQRACRLGLALGHGDVGATEGLGQVGAVDEADGDDAGPELRDVDVAEVERPGGHVHQPRAAEVDQ